MPINPALWANSISTLDAGEEVLSQAISTLQTTRAMLKDLRPLNHAVLIAEASGNPELSNTVAASQERLGALATHLSGTVANTLSILSVSISASSPVLANLLAESA